MKRLTLAAIALIGWAGLATAQTAPGARIVAWVKALDDANAAVTAAQASDEALVEHRQRLTEIRVQARALGRAEERHAAAVKRLTDIVGPAPDDKAPPEPPEITARRKAIETEAQAVAATVKQAGVVATMSELLIERIDARRRALLYGALVHPTASIYAPAGWVEAWQVLRATSETHHARPFAPRGDERLWWLGGALAIFALALRLLPASAIGAKRAGGAPPLYRRRLIAALRDSLLHGALLAGAFWLGARAYAHILQPSQFAAEIAEGLALGVGSTMATLALVDAALRPNAPAWRLLPLGNGAARRLRDHVARVAILIGVLFGVRFAFPEAALKPIFGETFGAAFALIAACAVFWLLPQNLWKPGGPAARSLPQLRPLEQRRFDLWTLLRRSVGIVVAFSVAAILLGYGLLGAFVLRNLMLMGVVAGALLLLRTVAREAALSGIDWIETEKGFRVLSEMPTLSRWLVLAAVDLAVVVLGVVVLMPLWGFDWSEVVDGFVHLWTGFDVGNVRIRPSDVALATLVFALILAVTRWAQRMMDRRLMNDASIDIGVRTALRTGVGYVGIGSAIAAVIGLIGFDLTNFALIAGALSVGIGFGMQNLFNNFVSGVILLIERPIKVGDWVEVGDREGRVKRIDVRSTEIETDQRSSVMVPNSDILQTAVVNWTHKDRIARIDIRVAVSGAAEIGKVEELLIGCATADPRIADDPPPHVLLQDIGDDHLEFELRAFAVNVDEKLFVASDLRKRVLKALADAGIQSRHANVLPLLRPSTPSTPAKPGDKKH
jgi:small-conductance mechanosensitive channel